MEEIATAIIRLTNTRDSCSVFSSSRNNPVHLNTHINKDVVYWRKHPAKLILSWWPHDVAVPQVSLRANLKISCSTFSYSRTRRVSKLNGKHISVDWCVLWSNLSSFLLALPDAHLPSCHVLLALMLRVGISKETIILSIN